jgi:hypothetical protein
MGVVKATNGRFTPEKDLAPNVFEAGWTPGPAWNGAENLAPAGIRSPDRPARSESLYRLPYPGPRLWDKWKNTAQLATDDNMAHAHCKLDN